MGSFDEGDEHGAAARPSGGPGTAAEERDTTMVIGGEDEEEASLVLHTNKRQMSNARASSRSWRSLDEEVRTASSSSFSLLTAEESYE
jgi:hypothetical protein